MFCLFILLFISSANCQSSNFKRLLSKKNRSNAGEFRRDPIYNVLDNFNKSRHNDLLFSNYPPNPSGQSSLNTNNFEYLDNSNSKGNPSKDLLTGNGFKNYFTKIGWKSVLPIQNEEKKDESPIELNGRSNLKGENQLDINKNRIDRKNSSKFNLNNFEVLGQQNSINKPIYLRPLSGYVYSNIQPDDKNATRNQDMISTNSNKINRFSISPSDYKWQTNKNISELFSINKSTSRLNINTADSNKLDSDQQVGKNGFKVVRPPGIKKTLDPLINSIMLEPSPIPEPESIRSTKKLFDVIQNQNQKDILNLSMIMNGLRPDQQFSKNLDTVSDQKVEKDLKVGPNYDPKELANLFYITQPPYFFNEDDKHREDEHNRYRLKVFQQSLPCSKTFLKMMGTNSTSYLNADSTHSPTEESLVLIPLNKIRIGDNPSMPINVNDIKINNFDKKVKPLTDERQKLLNYNNLIGKSFGDIDMRSLLDISSTNINPMIPVLNLFVITHSKSDKKDEDAFKRRMEESMKHSKTNISSSFNPKTLMDKFLLPYPQFSQNASSDIFTHEVESTTALMSQENNNATQPLTNNSFLCINNNKISNKLHNILPILMVTANMALKKYSVMPKCYDAYHFNGITRRYADNLIKKYNTSTNYCQLSNDSTNITYDLPANKTEFPGSYLKFEESTGTKIKEQSYNYSKLITTEYSHVGTPLSEYSYIPNTAMPNSFFEYSVVINKTEVANPTNNTSPISRITEKFVGYGVSTEPLYTRSQCNYYQMAFDDKNSTVKIESSSPFPYLNVLPMNPQRTNECNINSTNQTNMNCLPDNKMVKLSSWNKLCNIHPKKYLKNNLNITFLGSATKQNYSVFDQNKLSSAKGLRRVMFKGLPNSIQEKADTQVFQLTTSRSNETSQYSQYFTRAYKTQDYNMQCKSLIDFKSRPGDFKTTPYSRVNIPLVVKTGSESRVVLFPLVNPSNMINETGPSRVNQSGAAMKLEDNNLNIVPMFETNSTENKSKTSHQGVRVNSPEGTMDSYILPNLYIDVSDSNKTSIINSSGLSLKVVMSKNDSSNDLNTTTSCRSSTKFDDSFLFPKEYIESTTAFTGSSSTRAFRCQKPNFNNLSGTIKSFAKILPDVPKMSFLVDEEGNSLMQSKPKLKTKIENENIPKKQSIVVVAIDSAANRGPRLNKSTIPSSLNNQLPVKIYVFKSPSYSKFMLPESGIHRAIKPPMVWPNCNNTYDDTSCGQDYNAYQQQLWNYYQYYNQLAQNQQNYTGPNTTCNSSSQPSNNSQTAEERCQTEVTVFPVFPMYPVYPLNPLIQHTSCNPCQTSLNESKHKNIAYLLLPE